MRTASFFEGISFDPETVQMMGRAFDQACTALRGFGDAEAVQAIVAKEIVELAGLGERDPVRLCEKALKVLGVESASDNLEAA